MTSGVSDQAMPGMSGIPSPAASASATAADSPAPQGGKAVAITDFKFSPATLTVPVGTTVSWTNQDEEPLTIASNVGSFQSHGMDSHGTYRFSITSTCSTSYFSSISP